MSVSQDVRTKVFGRQLPVRQRLQFTCPQCGGHDLYSLTRETSSCAIEVLEIYADGEVILGTADVSEDFCDIFCCADCDFEIWGRHPMVTTDKDLVKWISENCATEDNCEQEG
jgi:hypothetical protein